MLTLLNLLLCYRYMLVGRLLVVGSSVINALSPLLNQAPSYLSALTSVLSSPDYERFIKEGAKLPALVCVITGKNICVTILSVLTEGLIVTFVLC